VNAEPAPELSVIVVALDGGANLERCLDALARQEACPAMEVLVAVNAEAHRREMEQRYPRAQFVVPERRSTFAELRGAAVRRSRGRIVAITEDQCIPPAQWCANVVAAHASRPYAAIGGPVDKQGEDSALNWAIYLRELGVGYMPPVEEGPSAQLTDCNVTYKRAALDRITDAWAESFHEPRVHEALKRNGEPLWLSPALLTLQQRSFTLQRAVVERYEFGRLYGSMRVAGAPLARCMMMAAASVALPVLLVARVLLTVLRKRRHVGPCLRALPYLALFATVWAWGEFLGYLTGAPSKSWRGRKPG